MASNLVHQLPFLFESCYQVFPCFNTFPVSTFRHQWKQVVSSSITIRKVIVWKRSTVSHGKTSKNNLTILRCVLLKIHNCVVCVAQKAELKFQPVAFSRMTRIQWSRCREVRSFLILEATTAGVGRSSFWKAAGIEAAPLLVAPVTETDQSTVIFWGEKESMSGKPQAAKSMTYFLRMSRLNGVT